MTQSIASSQTRLKTARAKAHPFCLVCSQSNPLGLGLEFTAHDDGSVSALFLGHSALEGYQGLLHGGMIASLLDGAMTNCLFAHGRLAMTAELKVRYRKPVIIGEEIFIRAWITKSFPPLYCLKAELRQKDCVNATAMAKFMQCNERADCRHHTGRE